MKDYRTYSFWLETAGDEDQLQVKRLKKRKLHLKDQITSVEDRLTPDIIA